jgi:hypothetical protein
LCFLFVVDGTRFNTDYGIYVSMTGLLLSIPCTSYSSYVWSSEFFGSDFTNQADYLTLLQGWIWLSWSPIAMVHKSELIGFGSVVSFFSFLGFSFAVEQLCIFIGFDSEESAVRISLTSFIVVASFLACKLLIPDMIVDLLPFTTGILVFGSHLHFLSLLILCQFYESLNIIMMLSLTTFCAFGFIFSFQGIANTSITYAIIWLLIMYGNFHLKSELNPWVLLLLVSLFIWKISFYLHSHPDFVLAMFKSNVHG